MCGIAGFFARGLNDAGAALGSIALRMSAAIAHRGPDDEGVWADGHEGIALAHRRLSIIDLSPAGHQPMTSPSERYVMVFNGEIYNYRKLRARLEDTGNGAGPAFRGSSDTEVMLAAFDQWGVDAAVREFNGMFAFAVWDRRERALTICRDRCGEKPLYYGWMGATFLFGSELKALRAHPAFGGQIDRNSLALFLRYGYVPTPYSIYQNICKLAPGGILKIGQSADQGKVRPSTYWSAREVAESGARNPLSIGDGEAVAALDSLLSDAVERRMVADVPVGAFLSGGIDSSAVVALMQKSSSRPVRTFTIGFREARYDEASHAKKVARHLGCEHTELYVTPREAMETIPLLPALYDEPFADSSQIPTFLVSRLTRQSVTVSLSGDGGDEVFGGYTRYQWAGALERTSARMPAGVRKRAAQLLASCPHRAIERIFEAAAPLLPARLRQTNLEDKLGKLAAILPKDSPETMYRELVSLWSDPNSVVLGASEPPAKLTEHHEWAAVPDFAHQMMLLDTVTYLPDDILVKLDRASMGVSLESRAPLLDHRLIEFSWRLPPAMKIRKGQTKWLLKQVLYQYVPPELVNRPKAGFGVPLHDWLRGPLRAWAEELLDAGRLRREGFFEPGPIRRKWAEHLSGEHNWACPLWNVLMFQAWLEHSAESDACGREMHSSVAGRTQ